MSVTQVVAFSALRSSEERHCDASVWSTHRHDHFCLTMLREIPCQTKAIHPPVPDVSADGPAFDLPGATSAQHWDANTIVQDAFTRTPKPVPCFECPMYIPPFNIYIFRNIQACNALPKMLFRAHSAESPRLDRSLNHESRAHKGEFIALSLAIWA